MAHRAAKSPLDQGAAFALIQPLSQHGPFIALALLSHGALVPAQGTPCALKGKGKEQGRKGWDAPMKRAGML